MPEDSIGRIILDLVIVFIFILINAFFSAAEMAVISLNDAKIKKQAEDGDKKSKRVLRFIENPAYNEANNISSALVARYLLSNAYVFEADLLISNPAIIHRYHYTSDFLAIKKERTDDWCFVVRNGIIQEEKVGGAGNQIWQMVGISYWNEADGHRLSQDIADVYASPGGKERYWEQVPLVYARDHYQVEILSCTEEDVTEIDTFRELKAIDKTYDV